MCCGTVVCLIQGSTLKRFEHLHASEYFPNRLGNGLKPHTEVVSRKRFRFGAFTLKALWQEALSKRFRRYVEMGLMTLRLGRAAPARDPCQGAINRTRTTQCTTPDTDVLSLQWYWTFHLACYIYITLYF